MKAVSFSRVRVHISAIKGLSDIQSLESPETKIWHKYGYWEFTAGWDADHPACWRRKGIAPVDREEIWNHVKTVVAQAG